MARKNDENIAVASCTLFIIILSQIPSNGFVAGGRGSIVKQEKSKIIMSENGDIFDCVDIYKQPAFNHPLLKNHTIQMQPSISAGKLGARSSDVGLFQSWRKNEKCPKGTVPIIRTKFPPRRRTNYKFIGNETNRDRILQDTSIPHEYALVNMIGESGIYYGAKASLNVWNPRVAASDEFSLAQIWVVAGQGNELNTIEAGWQVYEDVYGDVTTRFFIFWTSDNYQSIGCYNLECEGFMQTNLDIQIGGVINEVSIYDGPQYEITLSLHREPSGNWWLNYNDVPVGYWPASILPHLRNGATTIQFGGEIVNSRPEGPHTTTEMGSGHFPNQGLGRSAAFTNLGYYDTNLIIKDPTALEPLQLHPNCYAVQLGEQRDPTYGIYFFYGGPGLSPQCP